MMGKKPWYIWLSLPAFMLLFFDSGLRSRHYEWKNKISVLDGKSVWFIFVGHALLMWLVFLGIPLTVLGRLTPWIERQTFPLEIILGIAWWFALYFTGVYATYRHVQWRNKHMSHILKPKQDKDSSERVQISTEEE